MVYTSRIYAKAHTIYFKMCNYITLCVLPDYLDKCVVIVFRGTKE